MIDIKGIIDSISEASEKVSKSVTDIVSTAKGKLAPEKEIELAKANSDFQLALQKSMLSLMESQNMRPTWLIAWKGLIRPAFATIFLLQFVWLSAIDFFHLIIWKTESYEMVLFSMPSGWWAMFGIVLSFYFGERIVSNALDRIKK